VFEKAESRRFMTEDYRDVKQAMQIAAMDQPPIE